MENRQEIYELVALCRENDRTAQRMIFEKFKNEMFAICKRYSKSVPEAEDCLIEGFTRAFIKIDTYSGQGNFESWLRKVIINHCATVYNRELKHNSLERIDESIEDEAEEETSSLYSKEDLYKALNSIGDRQRLVFNMVVIDGYSYSDVAREIGVSSDVIRTVLYRAKQNLRKYLFKLEQREGR